VSLIVIPFCLSAWMSVGHSATYSLPRLIDHNQIWSDPCKPFWIHYLPCFRCQRENMQNFAYFQRQPFNAYSCLCERDASCHMTCLSVCLSVWLSVHLHNSKTAQPNFAKFFVHVARGRVSVLLLRHCNVSSFMDDVIFSYPGNYVCINYTLRQRTGSVELTLHCEYAVLTSR